MIGVAPAARGCGVEIGDAECGHWGFFFLGLVGYGGLGLCELLTSGGKVSVS